MTDNNGNIEHMAELVEKVLSALNDETYEDGMKGRWYESPGYL